MIRLNKYLAHCGLGSRRKCDHLIQSGYVTVNGKTITELGTSIDETNDDVRFDNRPVANVGRKVYILLNKPAGYVTSVKDELHRKTVLDLIPDEVRVFPVGRLDKNTVGLLLLTNDGELCYQLTHPKFEIDKIYQVTIDKELRTSDKSKLELGIMLETGMTAPCNIRCSTKNNRARTLTVTIHEGKKRQIRRMFDALGYRVKHLERIQFGDLTIGKLPAGGWRYLKDSEILGLKKIS